MPTYLIEKIARHGAAAQRLTLELEQKRGEFAHQSEVSAAAFDAADFVWAYFALRGNESVQQSRSVRNRVAEAIANVLEETLHDDTLGEPIAVFENDGSRLSPNQIDGFQDLPGHDGVDDHQVGGMIQINVRDAGERTLLNVHVPERLRELFIKRLYAGSLPGETWPVPIALELSPQSRWITDDKQRASARRRKEAIHLCIPLDEIHVNYGDESTPTAK